MYKLPVLINWSLTERCNLSCGFCFRFHDKELNHKAKKTIIDKIIKSGVKRVTLTGGEPTLVKHLTNISNTLRLSGVFVSLHTNGINTEYIKENYNHFDRISLSLDGHNSSINKNMRGHENYFEKVINIIEFLNKKEYDFAIKTIVTKQNIHSIPRMVDFINKVKPVFWSLFEFLPLENGSINKDEYLLEDGEYNNLILKLKCDIQLNTMSSVEASRYPMFCVAANGDVYTKDVENRKSLIASLLNDNMNIETIWEKIIKKNQITEKYIEKWTIIKNNHRYRFENVKTPNEKYSTTSETSGL